eukprot:7457106-Ditylum_brightwellii.AAC.1
MISASKLPYVVGNSEHLAVLIYVIQFDAVHSSLQFAGVLLLYCLILHDKGNFYLLDALNMN